MLPPFVLLLALSLSGIFTLIALLCSLLPSPTFEALEKLRDFFMKLSISLFLILGFLFLGVIIVEVLKLL